MTKVKMKVPIQVLPPVEVVVVQLTKLGLHMYSLLLLLKLDSKPQQLQQLRHRLRTKMPTLILKMEPILRLGMFLILVEWILL